MIRASQVGGPRVAGARRKPRLYVLNTEQAFQEVLAEPALASRRLWLLWCRAESRIETEGAHVCSVWRNNLNETAAMLFAPRR